jgi:glycosyltransferase involved in cell wall biosynthesis
MTQPKVSILVAAYQAADLIGDTVASALAQDWENLEVIVVDDGSSDGTGDVVAAIDDPRLTLIRQENQGQTGATNTALEASSGDFVSYLDADDLISRDKVRLQMEHLASELPRTIATCAWGRFVDHPARAEVHKPSDLHADHEPLELWLKLWQRNSMIHGATWMISRELIKKGGLYDPELTLINDLDYFTRTVLNARQVVYTPTAKTFYRSGDPASLSAAKSDRAWRSAFRATEKATGCVLQREDSPRTREASALLYQRFAYTAYPQVPDLVRKAQERVHELGGCDEAPMGGPKFQLLRQLFGWKLARRIQALAGIRP